ncbi:MAG TPA: PqqD family protein [Baekduia sp.]|uniref:PqqD family protein n=1 Tax=Baekduia sp. TaxID=2600305 RepID=UPI002BDD900C|nr:PqqD family protein [Baekduia sp.]HMJ34007.1 PqqD family protein [Baekduia sp.]
MTDTLRLNAARLRWTAIDDEVVAVDKTSSVYLAANSSGAALWDALARGATRGELVATLIAAYGLEPERAASDVDAFISELGRHGYLEA